MEEKIYAYPLFDFLVKEASILILALILNIGILEMTLIYWMVALLIEVCVVDFDEGDNNEH